MTWSKPFTVKSNARRAARAAGCNPNSVRACPGGYQYNEDSSVTRAADAASPVKHAGKPPRRKADKAAIARKRADKTPAPTKASKPPRREHTKSAGNAAGGTKTAQVLAMITAPGGANIDDICKATGWLPHTARARISGIVKANKLTIRRTRLLGKNIYQAEAA